MKLQAPFWHLHSWSNESLWRARNGYGSRFFGILAESGSQEITDRSVDFPGKLLAFELISLGVVRSAIFPCRSPCRAQ